MRLDIDPARVREILLPDGEWHQTANGSFHTGAYEFKHGEHTFFAAGQASGATWKERDESGNERVMFCPLTSIHAVSYGLAMKRRR